MIKFRYYNIVCNIVLLFLYDSIALHCDKIIAIINPYRPKASAKINIRIIPTNILASMALALTPASPTTPIAKPAA